MSVPQGLQPWVPEKLCKQILFSGFIARSTAIESNPSTQHAAWRSHNAGLVALSSLEVAPVAGPSHDMAVLPSPVRGSLCMLW